MLHILLTTIRLIFKLLFLPVRAALHVLAFALETLLKIGTIGTTIVSVICFLGMIVALIEGKPVTSIEVWMPFVMGLIFKALPYIGAVIVAIPVTIAEFLKQITSAHPFQDLDLEGGKFDEV